MSSSTRCAPRRSRSSAFGYDDVAAINPDIVYTNCYGYSRRGPEADLPAYDDTIQAECGLAAVQQMLTGEPGFVGTIMADKVAGPDRALCDHDGAVPPRAHGRGAGSRGRHVRDHGRFMLVEHANGAMFTPPLGPAFYPRVVSRNRRPYKTTRRLYRRRSSTTTSTGPPSVEAVKPAWAGEHFSTLEKRAKADRQGLWRCWAKPSPSAPPRNG